MGDEDQNRLCFGSLLLAIETESIPNPTVFVIANQLLIYLCNIHNCGTNITEVYLEFSGQEKRNVVREGSRQRFLREWLLD